MLVLGVLGRARHGKTEAAMAVEAAAKSRGLSVQTYDIGAEVLKYCIAEGLLPAKTREELNKDELAVLVHTGKKARERDDSFWIAKITGSMLSAYPDVAIVPNIRYRNETEWVKSLGGKTIRVKALNPDGSEFISYDRDPNHPSETELHSFATDYYITTLRGQPELVRSMAASIFDFEYKRAVQ